MGCRDTAVDGAKGNGENPVQESGDDALPDSDNSIWKREKKATAEPTAEEEFDKYLEGMFL